MVSKMAPDVKTAPRWPQDGAKQAPGGPGIAPRGKGSHPPHRLHINHKIPSSPRVADRAAPSPIPGSRGAGSTRCKTVSLIGSVFVFGYQTKLDSIGTSGLRDRHVL